MPALNDVATFDFITNANTGAAVDADSTPTCEIFEGDNDTAMSVTITVAKRTGKTGNYRATFTASAAQGFENDKYYNLIASATVATIAGKARVTTFKLETTSLSGPSSVTLTFRDSLLAPVPLVNFTILGQASGTANTSGVAAFGLLDGTYTVVAAPKNGVFFPNTTLVVSGTTTANIDGTSPSVTPPANPDLSLVYGDLYDLQGNPAVGIQAKFSLVSDGPVIDAGILQQNPPQTATTDSAGHFEIELTKTSAMTPTGILYLIEIPQFKFKQRTTITASTFDVGTLIT